MTRYPVFAFVLFALSNTADAAAYRDPACAKLTFMGIGGEPLICPDQAGVCPDGTRGYGSQCHDPTLVRICPGGVPRARNESCE